MAVSRLNKLGPKSSTLKYDRNSITLGVLHIGPGAFHRAHQAVYFDDLLARDPGWGIHAVSMRSETLKQRLSPQDGLYTLAVLDREVSYQLVGSLLKISTAEDGAWKDSFLSEDLKLITLTVTEKGYCLDSRGHLNFDNSDIIADLSDGSRPKSVIGMLTYGLQIRYAENLPPPIIISCDNLPENGVKLKNAVVTFSARIDRNLSKWIESSVAFPCSMVDAITPATDEKLIAQVEKDVGFADAWPVQREVYSDWIIEQTGENDLSVLQDLGVTITSNLENFEQAKLRLLNGAHSCLTYIGLARGYDTVYDAMNDSEVNSKIQSLLRREIKPVLKSTKDLDLDLYVENLLNRFSNPAISHFLSQIAWDGSIKLPIRILETLFENLKVGRPSPILFLGVAAWMRFIRRSVRAEKPIVDPESIRLIRIGHECCDKGHVDVQKFLSMDFVFSAQLVGHPNIESELVKGYDHIMRMEEQFGVTV
ncbi:MAG: mannitol dehydrogenase family protein [Acidimicrobiales bacterium]|nr:mannitol dehydrogenase family protein [Hyphomonadaceae bacterium]RZV41668.1 MAG: mannitol dehydrogenase family protein [Acidimicrobiales bacterium]